MYLNLIHQCKFEMDYYLIIIEYFPISEIKRKNTLRE